MKILGCGCAVLGALICLASIAIFGTTIFRAASVRPVQTYPLALGSKLDTGPITVRTSRLCMISVRAKVQSSHAKKDLGDDDYDLQYHFPFRYTVLDAGGKDVASENHQFAWDTGARTFTGRYVSENGGSATITQDGKKFSVAPPGSIRVEAQIDSDTTYQASVSDLELLVYDDVSKHAGSVLAGIGLMASGAAMAFLGLVVFFVGLARGRKARAV